MPLVGHPARAALVVLLLGSCVDSPGTGSQPTPSPTPEAHDEVCNGLDDDQDGDTDEGFPDLDGDGRADCIDENCTIAFTEPGGPDTEFTCVLVDPGPAQEWRLDRYELLAAEPDGGPMHWGLDAASIPVIGAMEGAGASTILVGRYHSPTTLEVLSAEGNTLWSAPSMSGRVAPLWADISPDSPGPEIVDYHRIQTDDGNIASPRVLDQQGNTLWERLRVDGDYGVYVDAFHVADLDRDGWGEILLPPTVYDGETGEVRFQLPLTDSGVGHSWHRMPAIADIDLDGQAEILDGDGCFNSEGELLWTIAGDYDLAGWRTWVVLQDDDDPELEAAQIAGDHLTIVEHDGTIRSSVPTGARGVRAPPCAADFDGDGRMELAWVALRAVSETSFPEQLCVYETSGEVRWCQQVEDSSTAASCSAFDLDGDGAAELLYAGEEAFRIFSGLRGEELFRDDDHLSGTVFEYPTLADLDGDGSVEILTTGYSLTAYSHPRGRFPNGPAGWPVYDWNGLEVDEFGNLGPADPYEPHGLHAAPTRGRPEADLVPVVLDGCASGCIDSSQVLLVVRVENRGIAATDSPFTLAVLRGGAAPPLAVYQFDAPLEPGTATEPIQFEFELQQLTGEDLHVVADWEEGWVVGQQRECDEGNNRAVWTSPCSP